MNKKHLLKQREKSYYKISFYCQNLFTKMKSNLNQALIL